MKCISIFAKQTQSYKCNVKRNGRERKVTDKMIEISRCRYNCASVKIISCYIPWNDFVVCCPDFLLFIQLVQSIILTWHPDFFLPLDVRPHDLFSISTLHSWTRFKVIFSRIIHCRSWTITSNLWEISFSGNKFRYIKSVKKLSFKEKKV